MTSRPLSFTPLAVATLAFGSLAACGHSPVPRPRSIARGVPLAGDTVTLGAAWVGAAKYEKGTGTGTDTTITIADGSVGGADRIVVSRSPSGVVRQVTLIYAGGRDFDALLLDLRARLGPPTDSGRIRSTVETRESWMWRDPDTQVVFVRFRGTRGYPYGMTVLTDVAQGKRASQ